MNQMLMASQIARVLNQLSLEPNDEKDWFFACWYKFIEIVVINGCAHTGYSILKLTKIHEEINGINWFLVRWYKFRKA